MRVHARAHMRKDDNTALKRTHFHAPNKFSTFKSEISWKCRIPRNIVIRISNLMIPNDGEFRFIAASTAILYNEYAAASIIMGIFARGAA